MPINEPDDTYFTDLAGLIDKIHNGLAQINELFKTKGVGPLESPQQLRDFVSRSSSDKDLELVENLIRQCVDMNARVRNTINNYEDTWRISLEKKEDENSLELDHAKATRRSERQDMWVSWFQKAIRWSLGVILAVLLYSMVVWMSEKTEFIKVPIKDWLPAQQP